MNLIEKIKRHMVIRKAMSLLKKEVYPITINEIEKYAFKTACMGFYELEHQVPLLYILMAAQEVKDNRLRMAHQKEAAE
jgi:hypothetical protein